MYHVYIAQAMYTPQYHNWVRSQGVGIENDHCIVGVCMLKHLSTQGYGVPLNERLDDANPSCVQTAFHPPALFVVYLCRTRQEVDGNVACPKGQILQNIISN